MKNYLRSIAAMLFLACAIYMPQAEAGVLRYSGYGDNCCDPCSKPCDTQVCGCGFDLAVRAAYFYPTSSETRDVYSGDAIYQLELGYRIQDACGITPYSLFASAGYYSDSGHSEVLDNHTHVRLYPFAVGAKYNFCLSSCLDAYLGAGVTYSLLRIHDESEFVEEHVSKNSFGALAKSGIRYRFCDCAFVDLFIDYYYTNFHFSGTTSENIERHSVNMSALLFGGAIGYGF